jgi:hypothetical protein
MALSASVLSAALRARLLADADIQARDSESLTAYCDAIAAVVVEHITAAAVVTIPPGVPVATTGTAAAQAGATTAPAVGAIT